MAPHTFNHARGPQLNLPWSSFRMYLSIQHHLEDRTTRQTNQSANLKCPSLMWVKVWCPCECCALTVLTVHTIVVVQLYMPLYAPLVIRYSSRCDIQDEKAESTRLRMSTNFTISWYLNHHGGELCSSHRYQASGCLFELRFSTALSLQFDGSSSELPTVPIR